MMKGECCKSSMSKVGLHIRWIATPSAPSALMTKSATLGTVPNLKAMSTVGLLSLIK